ncbi:RbsD/FucU family protein [Aestuariivirga litoralis]|uniref:RbsD/FucU family protein n=1 Tax=Aestuariivirga litoralis TaxID=2650924 RepID=UPI0018C63DF3|nr:RbsD/FucU domain-containing protein [Aestuariivirga litoralis]MBG1233807.1 transporter [Aestuariivirga litoralis]
MLRGINPLLSPDLLKVLCAMGHGDEIAIVDGNYPADTDAKRLVRLDGHSATDILEACLSVIPLDEMVPDCAFRPAAGGDPKRIEPIFTDFEKIVKKWEPARDVKPLIGKEFYDRVKACYAIVASGERRLYGNIVLKKGVIHP